MSGAAVQSPPREAPAVVATKPARGASHQSANQANRDTRRSARSRGRPAGAREQLTREVRLVHLGHFAFMRAIIQGLPVAENYARYLANEEVTFRADRVVSSTVRWLRSELAAASRKAARHGRARLIELDLNEIPPSHDTLPDMQEWAADNGWDGFSETEILQAYREAFAGQASTRLARRTRLIDKQLEAVCWLEALIAQKPGAGDACAAWFGAVVAKRLTKADILTVAQLIERINGIGRHWYRAIKGIGPGKAARIEGWLRDHAKTLGMTLGTHVTVPRMRLYPEELAKVVAPATAIRPLEKFLIPAQLDGSAGRFRQPVSQCLMSARNDYEAILAWLQSKQPLNPAAQARKRSRRRGRTVIDPNAPLAWLEVLSHTQRACRKEAERFLLWAILERRKPLSSMTTEDCTAYRDFLADPQPRDDWCGQRGRERWSPLWRPFAGPLSVPAQHQAITILKNLYFFLTHQNYLMGNPWVGVAMPRKAQQAMNTGRSFTKQQWLFVNGQLQAQMVDEDKKPAEERNPERLLRLAVILGLLYATGLRLSEAVNARVGDLTWVEYASKGQDTPTTGWELSVVGKGGKLREVVVPRSVITQLQSYLRARGLTDDINSPSVAQAYLLAPLMKRNEMLDRLDRGAARVIDADTTIELVADRTKSIHRPLADNTLYAMLKTFFVQCAGAQAKTSAKSAERFMKASTHWLRHTHASHTIASGVPIEVAQASLGHASLATTTVYVTTEKERRMRTMQAALGE